MVDSPATRPPANPVLSAVDWGLLCALSVLWGGSFFFVGVAVHDVPPFTIVLARTGLAAVALAVYVRASGLHLALPRSRWAQFAVMGVLNGAIPYSLIVWGQTEIDSGVASILNGTTPLFSVLLTPLFTRDERLTPGRLGGVLLGLAGLAVMIGVDSLRGLDAHVLGQYAVVGGALSYAFAAIYGRRFRGLSTPVVATWQCAATALWVLPASLLLERPWLLHPAASSWGALLGLALLSTALAYPLYFRILASAGATNLLLVTLLIPVSALALGVLLLGERPPWSAFAGMVLIFAGIVAVDGRLPRRLARGRPDRLAPQRG